jgi:hypothetical protein
MRMKSSRPVPLVRGARPARDPSSESCAVPRCQPDGVSPEGPARSVQSPVQPDQPRSIQPGLHGPIERVGYVRLSDGSWQVAIAMATHWQASRPLRLVIAETLLLRVVYIYLVIIISTLLYRR